MGVKIGSDAGKIGKNTRLLVVMRARLSHKIGLHNLTNWNRLKKMKRLETIYKTYLQLLKSFFNVTCAHLITTHTQKCRPLVGVSWGFVLGVCPGGGIGMFHANFNKKMENVRDSQ